MAVETVLLSRLHKYPLEVRYIMLEYLTALTMLLLVFGHAMLIHKCTKLTDGLEPSANNLSSELKDIIQVLDDVADLLNDGLNMVTAKTGQTAQTGMDIPSLLTNLFMSKVNMGSEHGDPQEQTRTIQESDYETLSEEATD